MHYFIGAHIPTFNVSGLASLVNGIYNPKCFTIPGFLGNDLSWYEPAQLQIFIIFGKRGNLEKLKSFLMNNVSFYFRKTINRREYAYSTLHKLYKAGAEKYLKEKRKEGSDEVAKEKLLELFANEQTEE